MSRVTAATRARLRYRPKAPRVLVRRDGRTPRKQRVRPGTGVFADAHRPRPGVYARVPAWWSLRSFLWFVVPVLLQHHRTQATLRARRIDPHTFARWVRAEARRADPRNGRGVCVRPDTIAREIGTCERTVQRCRAAARELELLVDVLAGRRIRETDISDDQRYYEGGHIVGFCTVSAFAIPRWLLGAGDHVTLSIGPPQVACRRTVICGEGGPSGDARRGGAEPTSSAAAGKKRSWPGKRTKRARTAADRAAAGLAAALVARVTWLHGVEPWRLVPGLRRFAAAGWLDVDLVDAIDLVQQRNSYSTPTRDQVRRPWALLAWYLRDLDPQADHPRPELIALREAERPWCGTCDPRTRLRGLDRPGPCPACHPSSRVAP